MCTVQRPNRQQEHTQHVNCHVFEEVSEQGIRAQMKQRLHQYTSQLTCTGHVQTLTLGTTGTARFSRDPGESWLVGSGLFMNENTLPTVRCYSFFDYKMYKNFWGRCNILRHYDTGLSTYSSFMFQEKKLSSHWESWEPQDPTGCAWHRSMAIKRVKPAIITVNSVKPWQQKLVSETQRASRSIPSGVHQTPNFRIHLLATATSQKWALHACICKPT